MPVKHQRVGVSGSNSCANGWSLVGPIRSSPNISTIARRTSMLVDDGEIDAASGVRVGSIEAVAMITIGI